MSGVEGRCGLCGNPWSQECIELSCEPPSAPTEQADGGVVATHAELVEALRRQTDNMAFVLNRVDLQAWGDKFEQELTEDRGLLTPPATPIAGGFGSNRQGDLPTEPVADRWADLERLEGEAKPGPWEYTMGASGCPCIEDEAGRVVASYLTAEDAAFIAAARSSILELIAAARRAGEAGQ